MTDGVSIVIPVYNVERYLARCLDSIIEQTYTNLEVIIVDDGATDGSYDVCQRYAALDRRIRILRKPNGGLSDARNAGLGIASKPYVMFIDADDWIEPDTVDEMLRAARDSDADVVVAGCYIDHEDLLGRSIASEVRMVATDRIGLPGGLIPDVTNDLVNLIGYAWNKMYRRTFLTHSRLSFEVGLTLVEDAVFNSAVFTSGASVVLVPNAYVHYVQRVRPSLGTVFAADDLKLLLTSIQSKAAVLRHWGCLNGSVRRVERDLAIDALTGVVRIFAVNRDMRLHEKVSRSSLALGTSPALDLFDLIEFGGPIDRRHRLLRLLLRSRRVHLLVLALSFWHARDNARTPGTSSVSMSGTNLPSTRPLPESELKPDGTD